MGRDNLHPPYLTAFKPKPTQAAIDSNRLRLLQILPILIQKGAIMDWQFRAILFVRLTMTTKIK